MTKHRKASSARMARKQGSCAPSHAANGWRPGRGQPSTTNAYGLLESLDEQEFETGEMNSYLTERFGVMQTEDHQPDVESIPYTHPSLRNQDIAVYYQDAPRTVARAGAWATKPEIPTATEILADPSCSEDSILDIDDKIRPNKVDGPYESNEEYLGTQYELLREDLIRPLREAVKQVQLEPQQLEADYANGIGVYEPVYLKGIQFSARGLSAKVAFSLSRVQKYIRWKQSKRLMSGTLVALSPMADAFKTQCVLAIVGARPLSGLETNNPPELDLFIARPEDFDFDPMRKWIMVESRSSFFEAGRHTLLALQHMLREPFPLSRHLVKVQKDISIPASVEDDPYTDLGSLVSLDDSESFRDVNILKNWPGGDRLTLDTSQSNALSRMMTKSLAIVQGPPGTGKTHTSVVFLKTLLANMRAGDPPIIVTCQTNHALDQLLRHVAEFEPKFVRLGGQTKDQKVIKGRTLFEVRNDYKQQQPRIPGSRANRAFGEIRRLTAEMSQLLAPLESKDNPSALNHKLLAKMGLITEKQEMSLEIDAEAAMGIRQDIPGIQMEQWLGKCLQPCSRPFREDDFGLSYEEEDFDEVEKVEELEAEVVARDDDDLDALNGLFVSISDNFKGTMNGSLRTDDDIRRILDVTDDLTTIPVPDRGAIYNYLLRQAKRHIFGKFRPLVKKYDKAVFQRKLGRWEQDQPILQEQKLIGMTTTGLSKYRALISSLRPKVVLIEEAAETLEPPVTAACFPTLEHLVLVGDHQQLRPHCNLREFEDEPYNFNLSLFERLVLNEIPLNTLTRQRRMVPEIRRLLQPIYGETLKDHPSVKSTENRPPVEGMGGVNSFFLTHNWPESRDNNQSAKNEKEAQMIVGFYDYLVLNGVNPNQITILTFYNGQRKLITSKLQYHQNLRGQAHKVVTVDSYQGEENDIVLLSLVRSNNMSSIGFLSIDNRVCVALSRARRGFYLFGNAELLVCNSNTWEAVVKIFWGHGKGKKDLPTADLVTRIGYYLPLTCSKHGNKVYIEKPDDYELLSGGCEQKCRSTLPCGHKCMLRCHPFDHDRINCTQRCKQHVSACGHACNEMCCDPCMCLHCDSRNRGQKAVIKPVQAMGNNTGLRFSDPMMARNAVYSALPPITGPKAIASMTEMSPQGLIHASPSSTSVGAVSEFTMSPQSSKGGIGSISTKEQWQAYARGGVRAEDARARQKNEEKEARVLALISNSPGGATSPNATATAKLIQLSPEKAPPQPSANADLLIDMDDQPQSETSTPTTKRRAYTERFSYVDLPNTRQQKVNKADFNLLD